MQKLEVLQKEREAPAEILFISADELERELEELGMEIIHPVPQDPVARDERGVRAIWVSF